MIAFEYSDSIVNVFTNDAFDLKGTKNFVSICKNVGVDNFLLVLNNAQDDRKRYFSDYDIKGVIKHPIDYILPTSLRVRNFDMYVMEGKLLEYFLNLKTTNKEIEKLSLRLLESSKKGASKDEEK